MTDVIGQIAAAQVPASMTMAEEYWAARVPDPHGAMLWHWTPESDWTLASVEDSNAALADLMMRVAGTMGWQDDQRRWEERTRPFKAA
jgi:hypothetical protein